MNRDFHCTARVVAAIAAFTCAFTLTARAVEPAFRLVSSGPDGITLEFTLPQWSLTPVEHGGKTYSRLHAGGAELLQRPGFPVAPVFTAVLAVPPSATVTSSYSTGRQTQLQASPLEPAVLNTGITGGEVRYDTFSSEYLDGGEYPSAPVVISAPERLRDYRLVRVTVCPFAVDPAGGRVTVRQAATVNLRFSYNGDGRDRLASASPAQAEPLYRSLLLNWSDAGAWRLSRPERSVLAASNFDPAPRWAAVRIDSSAIYALSGSFLASSALGIDLTGVPPASIRLYAGPGAMLPEDPSVQQPGLREVAIRVTGAGDGSFDQGDRIIFYGQSLDRFTVDDTGAVGSLRHRYDSHAVYWLAWGDPAAVGLRMTEHVSGPVSGAQIVDRAERWFHYESNTRYFPDLHLEVERLNPAPDFWAWVENSDRGGQVDRSFSLATEPQSAGNLLRCQFYITENNVFHSWSLNLNGSQVGNGTNYLINSLTTSWLPLPDGVLIPGRNDFRLAGANQVLGFYEVRVNSALKLSAGERMLFHLRPQSGQAVQISETNPQEIVVYDITDPYRPVLVSGLETVAGTGIRFRPPVADGSLRSFAAHTDSAWAKPVSVRRVEPAGLKNLPGAEYVIIAPRSLTERARTLADWQAASFSTQVVSLEDIYDEFSLGLADPAAVRNFLKYAFESWPVAPRFAVLFGDGHNDYRGYTTEGRARLNLIPPYITGNDLALDEWFVRFQPGGLPQIALGRIPVQGTGDAAVAVDKVIRYGEGSDPGEWVRRTVLVADDGFVSGGVCDDVTNHVSGSEALDSLLPQELERRKIYLDRYPFDPPEIGTRKPAAARDLLELWNRGALLVNYLGHGSRTQWAQELVFDVERDLPMLNNGRRLPLVLNSSCSIGHFDDYRSDAMAERLMTKAGGGAIAVYAASRVTYAGQNQRLSILLVRNLFSEGRPSIGDAALLARAAVSPLDYSNAQRFILFGDPTQRLRLPARGMQFSLQRSGEINPGEKVDFSGTVQDLTGTLDVAFSGVAQVKFESVPKPVTIPYRCNLSGTMFERSVDFMQPGASLFDGSVTVSAGRFSGSFVLPLNLVSSLPADSLASGGGRFSGYATSERADAAGSGAETRISNQSVSLADSSGPGIKLLYRGRELADGDRVGVDEPLVMTLSDESGINTTGQPGYQIAVEVDEGASYSADLTGLFRYSTDSWREGQVSVDLRPVGEGLHSFRFRAADNALNSTRVEIMLSVSGSAGALSLGDVLNYPNPFREETDICFDLGAPADVLIRIFTVAGRPVRELRLYGASSGFNRLRWDGTDEYQQKVANGVYLYKIICRSTSNSISGTEEVEATGKALLSR